MTYNLFKICKVSILNYITIFTKYLLRPNCNKKTQHINVGNSIAPAIALFKKKFPTNIDLPGED